MKKNVNYSIVVLFIWVSVMATTLIWHLSSSREINLMAQTLETSVEESGESESSSVEESGESESSSVEESGESESSSVEESGESESSSVEESGESESSSVEESSESESLSSLEKEEPNNNENSISTNNESSSNNDSTTVLSEDTNVTNISEVELEDNYYFSVAKNQTTGDFINSLKNDAQKIAWENDLYASVMIAQAILETGSGNSTLSSSPNYNLFGVKGEYNKKSVSMSTQEDDGKGNLYTIKSAFRKYPSYKESLEDYAILLREGLSGNLNFYSNTWKSNTKNYQDATAFLTGRYATDTRYDKKLNALIETYKLTKYDTKLNSSSEVKSSNKKVESKVEAQIKNASTEKTKEQKSKENNDVGLVIYEDTSIYEKESTELSNENDSLMDIKVSEFSTQKKVDF